MPLWNAPLATQAEVDAAQATADAAVLAAAAAQAGADASCKKAQNLADVANAASSRNNIGANQIALETRFADLRAATGETRYLTWPFPSTSGFGTRIAVTLEGALLTANGALNITINGVATSPASITLTQDGSAAGSVFSATFVGANAIPGGAQIGLAVAGGNTAAVGAGVSLTAIF